MLAALAFIAGLYHTMNTPSSRVCSLWGRRGTACHRRAEHGGDGRADSSHAVDLSSVSHRVCRYFGIAPAERLCFGMAHLPGISALAVASRADHAAADSDGGGDACPDRCACGGLLVKAFGVTFLGHWRGHHHPQVHEADWPMRIGMLLAALTCVCLGIFPVVYIDWMDILAKQLVGSSISSSAAVHGWLWLTPVSPERASYSGTTVFLGIFGVVVAVYLLLHVRPGAIRRVPIWDCGFEKLNARMQYTATSFSMPIRRIFGHLFSIREEVSLAPQTAHKAFPKRLHIICAWSIVSGTGCTGRL